nr:rod-binding protein [uncultured Cohaesibacter sp.]
MTTVNSAPYSIVQSKGLQTNLSKQEQAQQAAQEFESVFLSQMLSGMFEGVGQDEFGDSFAQDTYRSLLTETYADEITKSGGIGIADSVMRELMNIQEVKQ